MILAVTEKLSWYTARSSGLVLWVIVTASVLLGLVMSTTHRRGPRGGLLVLHRYLGTLALVFTAVHLLALVADNYTTFGWSELFVPMASRWRPGAVAWGIVAFYLLVAIQLTSWTMRWLPRRLWHSVHLTSLVLFAAGTVHAVQSGNDTANRWLRVAGMLGIAAVVVLLAWRVLRRRSRRTSSAPTRRRTDAAPAVGSVDSAVDGMASAPS